MNGEGNGLAAPEISLPAATVERRVTVQNLIPLPCAWHTDSKVKSGHRRKVARNHEQLLGRPCASEIAERTLVGIVTINPLKASGIEVKLVERALSAVAGIEIADVALQESMR